VIFLGDFVDRGPEQLETVDIARKMVESGNALAVMGNHEFNAVAWATEDPEKSGRHLRAHSDKNLKQHREFLDQVGEGSQIHQSMVEWFRTLPVFLDLPDLRVVHACWHPEYLKNIGKYTDSQNRLLAMAWKASSEEGSEAFNIVETLLKGLEIPLPNGKHFHDKDGNKRTDIRSQWWRSGAEDLTYRNLAMVPAEDIENIPHEPVEAHVLPGYDEEKPVFVGHYWMTGEPAPLSDHIACLDYSIAGKHGGKLCAYRFDGEKRLHAEKFVWVESIKASS